MERPSSPMRAKYCEFVDIQSAGVLKYFPPFRYFSEFSPLPKHRFAAAMMTSSNGNIFRVTGHLCGEFTGEFPTQRPVTRSFDVFFDLRLNKRLSKQWWGWWFETLSRPLWRHRNGMSHSNLTGAFAAQLGRDLSIWLCSKNLTGIFVKWNISLADKLTNKA